MHVISTLGLTHWTCGTLLSCSMIGDQLSDFTGPQDIRTGSSLSLTWRRSSNREEWEDVPSSRAQIFRDLRSEKGEHMILDENAFVETLLPYSTSSSAR
jgi:hypothetical protein